MANTSSNTSTRVPVLARLPHDLAEALTEIAREEHLTRNAYLTRLVAADVKAHRNQQHSAA